MSKKPKSTVPSFGRVTINEIRELREEISQLRKINSFYLHQIASQFSSMENNWIGQAKSVQDIQDKLTELIAAGKEEYSRTKQSTFVPGSTHFTPGIWFYPDHKSNPHEEPRLIPFVPETPTTEIYKIPRVVIDNGPTTLKTNKKSSKTPSPSPKKQTP